MGLSRHTLPDGSWHFDWFIQRSRDPEARVVTFRTTEPLHRLGVEAGGLRRAVRIRRIEDHRSRYLVFSGPISGGRGEVRQVAKGRAIMHWTNWSGHGVVWFDGCLPYTVVLSPGTQDAGIWWLRPRGSCREPISVGCAF